MDTGYRLLAAQYVRRQAKQLADQLEGVRTAEDIEFVHRARVAARRLRAAFRMSEDCFTAKRTKYWRKAIRRITAALGEARDRDVQIEQLCGALSTMTAPECFPGVARVLVELERDRERLQRRVVAAVEQIEASDVLRDIRRATKTILDEAEPQPASAPSADAVARTREHVLRQMDEVLAHRDSLANPEDRERHHEMRIAAKRLRYTIEISRPAHLGRLDAALDAIKRLQTLLGDIHDCDMWLDHLDTFAAAERRRTIAMFGGPGRFHRVVVGIEQLEKDRRRCRQDKFRELVEFWSELDRREFWDELKAAVHPAVFEPPQQDQ